jgi:hypothetical protein
MIITLQGILFGKITLIFRHLCTQTIGRKKYNQSLRLYELAHAYDRRAQQL